MAFTDKDRDKLSTVHTLVTEQLAPWLQDHEERLRKVETTQTKGLAIFALLTVAFNSAIAWFGGHRG